MEKGKTGFNIMNLLAQSAAKINAVEDMSVKKRKREIKMPSTAAKLLDTASIVYHYLLGVSPSLASTLLDIHPDVDMDCNVTLEEVVEKWRRMAEKAAVSAVSKSKNEANEKVEIYKDSMRGRSYLKDDSKALHNKKEKVRKRSLNPDTVENEEIKTENKLSKKREGELKVKVARKARSTICRRKNHGFTPGEDSIILNKMNDMGDELNMKELAKEIGRPLGSVITRVRKLKSGSSRMHRKQFTLAEDEVIMERVLAGLQESKLCELDLHYTYFFL